MRKLAHVCLKLCLRDFGPSLDASRHGFVKGEMLLQVNLRVAVVFLLALTLLKLIKVVECCNTFWVSDSLLLLGTALDSRLLSCDCLVWIVRAQAWLIVAISKLLNGEVLLSDVWDSVVVREECSHRPFDDCIATLGASGIV